jgi:hypothetical protein
MTLDLDKLEALMREATARPARRCATGDGSAYTAAMMRACRGSGSTTPTSTVDSGRSFPRLGGWGSAFVSA